MLTILYIVLEGAIAALAFSYSAVVGVVFLLTFTLLGIIALWINFHFIKIKLDENYGRFPMRFPVGYITGLDIVDEKYSGPPRPEHADGTDWNSGVRPENRPSLVRCPFCQATVSKPGSRFCSDCGKAF